MNKKYILRQLILNDFDIPISEDVVEYNNMFKCLHIEKVNSLDLMNWLVNGKMKLI